MRVSDCPFYNGVLFFFPLLMQKMSPPPTIMNGPLLAYLARRREGDLQALTVGPGDTDYNKK